MFAAKVEKKDVGDAIKHLAEVNLLDRSRKVVRRDGFVEIPIVRRTDSYRCVVQAKPVYSRPRISPEFVKKSLMEELSEEETKMLKGGWEFIGRVMVIQVPPGLESKKYFIGEKLLEIFPRAKAVINRKGIKSEFREPNAEIIAGKETETIHRENNCMFRIDPLKVMFCAGNIEERRRMAYISNENEVVLDLFSGIGQFTIPIAKHSKPRKVISVEKNKVAFEYLTQNVELNRLKNVYPVLGDCREVDYTNEIDRVVMGYLFNTIEFLPHAARALKQRGVIHYHGIAAKKDIPRAVGRVKKILSKLGCSADVEPRIVKSYAPMLWHFVFDIKVGRACKSG
ncbi:MAG: class I SAM-dependent methyltransferase family protein [Candidatus Hydrothermarchaeaceae archaeon]